MLFATIAQPQLFLWMMISGMAAALWYACLEGIRKLMQAGWLLSLFTDTVFSLGLAAILGAFFVWGNYGSIRLYGLLGALCGFALMHFAMIAPIKGLLRILFKGIRLLYFNMKEKRLFNVIFK